MQGLQRAFAPLTSGFAAFAAGAAGFASISQAIASAKRDVESAERVLGALKGRRIEHERILKLTSQIQKETRRGDEELNETAALMLNMGIAAEDLDKALRVTADTAAALGLEFQTVARDVALLATTGQARMIPRFVSELKDLKEAGGDGAAALDLLAKKFSGQEARLAATAFGRMEQAANALGDQGERIGKVFADIKSKAMDALLPIVTKIADAIETPGVKIILDIIARELPSAIAIIATVLGTIIGAGIIGKILTAGVAIVTAVGMIVSGVLALWPIILGIGATIFLWPGLLESIKEFAAEIAEWATNLFADVMGIFEEIKAGQLTINDLFDFAATRARQFWLSFQATVLIPIILFTKAIGRIISGAFTLAVASVGKFLLMSLGGWELIIKKTIKAILKVAQDAVNLFVNFWNDVAETTGLFDPLTFASFADNFNTQVSNFVGDGIKTLDIAIKDSADKMNNSWEQAHDEMLLRRSEFNSQILEEERDLQDRLNTSRERRRQEAKEQERAELAAIQQTNASLLSEIEARQRTLADLRLLSATDFSNVRPEDVSRILAAKPTEEQKGLMVAGLTAQFDTGLVTIQEYLDLLREIQQTSFKTQISDLDAQIARQNEIIEHLQSQQVAQADNVQSAKEQVEISGKLNEALDKTVRLMEKRNEISTKLAGNEAQIRATAVSLAEGSLGKAGEARTALGVKRQETADLLAAGSIFQSEAIIRNNEALAQFKQKIVEVRQELDTLAVAAPAASAQIDQISAKVEQLSAETLATPPEGGFFQGMEAGFSSTLQQMGDLDATGAEVGASLASSLSQGLVDVFTKGKEAFGQFLVSFLAGITQMIGQMIIARAIMTALGIPPVPVGARTGGLVTQGGIRRARGGPVFGPDIDRDVVPALLAPGEFVVQRRAVEHYGMGYLHALNRMRAPRSPVSAPGSVNLTGRFQEGGPVGAGLPQTPTRAFIVSDEQTMDRILSGGEGSMLRWMREHATQLKPMFRE